jgi:hypothetical protein
MPDNQENFQTSTKQKLFPKNVLKKKIASLYYCTRVQIVQLKKQLKNLL